MARDRGSARTFIALIAWLCVTASGLLMLTQAAGWDGNGRMASLQALTPYVIAALIPVCGLAMWLERDRLAATTATIGLSGLLLAVPFAFPPSQAKPADDAVGLHAASINLLFRNQQVDEVADDLIERDLDVIVFIEYTLDHEAVMEAHPLAERFPYRIDFNDPKARGIAMWSRYPFVNPERRGTTSFGINVNIEGPDGEIRVMGVHPPTPVWNFDQWRDSLELIGDRALNNGPPTLIIGDLNASYWNPVFRRLLNRGFIDAHLAVGNRLGRSWPTDEFGPPLVQIDHALLGEGLVATSIVDFDVPGSDHRGFVVTVVPAR